jgi:hypothetical protein
MRVLRSIVVGHPSGSVSIATVQLAECGSVGSEFVGCEALGMNAISLQQLAQQSQGGTGVATLLNEHVQNLALVVDRAPQPHALTTDLHDHLIQVPATWSAWKVQQRTVPQLASMLRCASICSTSRKLRVNRK